MFEEARLIEEQKINDLKKLDGSENVYVLHELLGTAMTENVTVVRYNSELQKTLDAIHGIKERTGLLGLHMKGDTYNQELLFINQFCRMLEIAEVVTKGALLRDESRGAHYKPEFPERNDASWLKSTVATWTPDGPQIDYAPVDISITEPRLRVYNTDKTRSA